MFRGFHLWRAALHAANGHLTLAVQALHADPYEFSLMDAMILVGWLHGRRERMDQVFGPRPD